MSWLWNALKAIKNVLVNTIAFVNPLFYGLHSLILVVVNLVTSVASIAKAIWTSRVLIWALLVPLLGLMVSLYQVSMYGMDQVISESQNGAVTSNVNVTLGDVASEVPGGELGDMLEVVNEITPFEETIMMTVVLLEYAGVMAVVVGVRGIVPFW